MAPSRAFNTDGAPRASMRWNLRVITGLTADTEPCIIATVEQPPAKYVFNVGEGTTRACTQKKFGISKTKAVFLTRLSAEQVSGFPGLLMSLADAGTRDVTVCGPQGLSHYVASMRSYCGRPQMGVFLNEEGDPSSSQSNDPIYRDENLNVYGIPIYPNSRSPSPLPAGKRKRSGSPTPPSSPSRRLSLSGSRARSASPITDPQDANFNPTTLVGTAAEQWRRAIIGMMFRSPETLSQEGPQTMNPDELPDEARTSINLKQHYRKMLPWKTWPKSVMSYLVTSPPTRGKFDAQKASELGVNGPLRGKLSRGETIILPNGTTVTPDMCIAPSIPGTAFIYAHCPDVSYIEGLTTSSMISDALASKDVTLHVVIHRVGEEVLQDQRYKTWMSSFGSDVHHMVAAERHSPNPQVFWSVANAQLQLSELDNEMFRPPRVSDAPPSPLSSVSGLPPQTSILQQDIEVSMFPPRAPGPPLYLPQDEYQLAMDARRWGSYANPLADEYAAAREAVAATPLAKHIPGNDVVITPLGTGSAMPSKYRNVSATLLHIPEQGYVLLDCGEGTWGQIARNFGSQDAQKVLRELRCIFISHLHGDHHMGLAKLLRRRLSLDPQPEEPLYLIGTPLLFTYLREFSRLEDLGLDRSVKCINTFDLQEASSNPNEKIAALQSCLGFDSIQTVSVLHRTLCHGVVLRHTDGWSIAYSGDTMPCPALAEAAKGVTVLIHEATMADDQADLALAKAHSTCGQAIGIGRRANAKNILLTHFSQRYPKMPDLNARPLDESFNAGETEGQAEPVEMEEAAPIAVAFDCASMKIGSLWKMEKYMDAIAATFTMLSGDAAEDDTSGADLARPSSPTKRVAAAA